MAPAWLTVVAWTYLSFSFGGAAAIGGDIFVAGRRQPMGVMNAVFPITALYFGPLALAFYWRWGRAAARTAMASTPMAMAGMRHAHDGMDGEHGLGPSGSGEKPWWVMMAIEVSHCGS